MAVRRRLREEKFQLRQLNERHINILFIVYRMEAAAAAGGERKQMDGAPKNSPTT